MIISMKVLLKAILVSYVAFGWTTDPFWQSHDASLEWKKHTNQDGNFSVLAPGAILYVTDISFTEKKGKNYVFEAGDGVYNLTYYDLASRITDSTRITELIKDDKPNWGELVVTKDVSLEGFRGQEFKYLVKAPSRKSSFVIVRKFLVNKRVYTLSVMPAPDDQQGLENAFRYLDSFKLISVPKKR